MARRTGDKDRAARLARFDTTTLLRAVDDVDRLREHLDGDGYKPPEIRDDMLRLHQLAMKVVNQGYEGEARTEMFELAADIEERIDDIADVLDRLRETISGLVGLAPGDPDD